MHRGRTDMFVVQILFKNHFTLSLITPEVLGREAHFCFAFLDFLFSV